MLAKIGRAFPSTGAWERHDPQALRRVSNQYEAASQRPRLSGWLAPTLGANDATLGSLRTMRDRARAARRNDGYARKILRILVSELIGTGIVPKSEAPDREFARSVDALWERSAPTLDADGVLDAYGLQAQGVGCWLEAGEVFVRKRPRLPSDGLPVPLQVQLLEPEFLPHDEDGMARPRPGNRVRAGIELDAIGRRRAYHMIRVRPGEPSDLWGISRERIRIEADNVSPLYVPERIGQLRGVPTLNQTLVTLRDFKGRNDAVLLRERLANLFLGWVEDAGTAATDAAGTALDPVTGQPVERAADGLATLTLEPGMLLTPPFPGQKLAFNNPPSVGTDHEAANRQYLRQIGAGSDVPYHSLTGDMGQVNDRTARIIVQEFRRFLEQLQWLYVIPRLCQPMWAWWFDAAILSGALATPAGYREDPARWQRVEWTPNAWGYINPVQDVQTDKDRVRAGFASKRGIIRERGGDPEQVARERAEELAAADAAGVVDDTDPRKTSNAGLTQARPEGTTLPDVTGA